MKKINSVVAIATFFLASFSAHAQEDGQQMLTQGVNSGSENKYALRMLTPLDDTAEIGARMMLDEKTGIDLDFIFNFASDTKNGESEGLALALTASYFQYFQKERLSPYYKAGVNLSIFTDDKDIDANDVEDAEVAAALDALGFESDSHGDDDITLSAGLGTEYFVTPEFSLFAEALLKISFSPFTVETVSPQAGLSFYF